MKQKIKLPKKKIIKILKENGVKKEKMKKTKKNLRLMKWGNFIDNNRRLV